MKIIEYGFDDEQLILLLRHYFGSDEHFREHKQHFHRNPQKVFFVGMQGRTVIGYCSLHKHEIKDLTIIHRFRKKGFAEEFIKHLQQREQVLRFGTSNPYIVQLTLKLGFEHSVDRGIYAYYIWRKQ